MEPPLEMPRPPQEAQEGDTAQHRPLKQNSGVKMHKHVRRDEPNKPPVSDDGATATQ